MKSGQFSSKKNSLFFQGEKLSSSSQNLDNSYLKKQNPAYQKIQFLSQLNDIYHDVESFCSDFAQDVKLYEKQKDIKHDLAYYIGIMKGKKQIWLDNPRYQFTKAKLKQMKIQEDKERSDEKFHPYYEFLGYDRLEQVPKNRTQQEIIEQRYAYFLHQKGVDQAYQHLSSPTKKQEIEEDIKVQNQKRLIKIKSVIDRVSTNTDLLRKEDEELEQDKNDQSQQSSNSNISINQFSQTFDNNNILKRKSIFQPNNNSNKTSQSKLQRFFHSSSESRKQSSTSIKLKQNAFDSQMGNLNKKDNNQIQSRTQRSSLQQLFTIDNIKQEQNQEQENQTIIQNNGEESIPIIKQVLARYGRVNNKEGEQILNKIQNWRKEEDHQTVQNSQFFISKMEEQKNKYENQCANIEQDEQKQKKILMIQILKKKFSSKQAQKLEKMYKAEKEWDSTLEDAQSLSQSINNVINTARSRINSLKNNETSNPDIQKLYKKSQTQTGFFFVDRNSNMLK